MNAMKAKVTDTPAADEPGPQTMQVIPTRGDAVVIGLDGKYISVNGEPCDPDTGMPLTRPRELKPAAPAMDDIQS